MGKTSEKLVEYLIVDTTAFIQNAPLQDVAENMITCPEVVAEITNKRQLRRLVVLPYDLVVKEVFPEYVKIVTDFAKKTGDYPSLSATDIKVMALTYQLEKEKVGTSHLRLEPIMQKATVTTNTVTDMNPDVTGFFLPSKSKKSIDKECSNVQNEDGELPENVGSENKTQINENLIERFETLKCLDNNLTGTDESDVLVSVQNFDTDESETDDDSDWITPSNIKVDSELTNESDVLVSVQDSDKDESETDDSDDDSGWITPSNIQVAKKQINSELIEEKHVTVACMTTDFAMQNVLRQMNLNVSALDGRMIKQLRTYILRCYTCFKTTSIMSKQFCPKCGNNTLKKVAVSLDENGKMQIHINPRRLLTGRGKKFSLPRIKGGKHPNNPILVEDQPMADNRPSRLARTKINPLDDDYIAGFSPFVTRDVNSKSAQLGIRPGQEFKHWMRKNPNEARRKKK